jgi:hypothetical protein
MEGRRQPKPPWPAYRPDLDVFLPPYTGETVIESPDNPIVYVDSATGAWPPDGPAPRREVVSEANCLRCHGRLELHGSVRHQVQYCVFCHNPTATDWPGRPKVGGSVSLPLTWDGIEERSVHFKVMIHRIHTGARKGASSLEAIQPFLVYHGSPAFFDDVIFPGNLASCPTCHTGKTYLVDHVPAGVQATIANETATVIHTSGSGTPVAGELTTPPITAACQACHETGTTFAHTASYTKNGVESCASCHVTGSNAVDVVHGLVPAVGTAASASFSSIVQNILVPSCATSGCHASGGTPPVLDAASAYNALVNAASAESSMVLVTPGSTDKSYLVYKLLGDVASAGGTGSMMPPQGSLAPADIAAIEAWIQNGAPND